MKKVSTERRGLENAEVCINFANKAAVTIRPQDVETATNRIYIGYDEKNEFVYIWENPSFGANIGYYIVDTFLGLLDRLRNRFLLAIVG